MDRCYWCGSVATTQVSSAFICDRHYKEFLEIFGQKQNETLHLVKSSTASTHSLQACENLKNTQPNPQHCVDQERACG